MNTNKANRKGNLRLSKSKRAFVWAALAGIVMFTASCHSHGSCPAYGGGKAHHGGKQYR